MIRKSSISAAMALPFALAQPAQADMVNTTADLQLNKAASAYVFSREMLMDMLRLGVEQDKKFGLQTDCKSGYDVRASSTAIVVSPIEFLEGKPHPVKGTWVTRYKLVRCGDAKVYNALFMADGTGGAPRYGAFFPGTSYGGPRLLSDAAGSARAAALAVKDCSTPDVFDIRVVDEPHDLVENGKTFQRVWSELWTYRMCGQMVDVPMTFVPDAQGGGTSFTSGKATLRAATAAP